MDKQTIGQSNSPAQPEEAYLVESEQIWQYIGSYYLLFYRKKFLVLLFCLIGAAAGLTYALLHKSRYKAEVKFTSTIDNDNASGYLGLAQQFGLISGGSSPNTVFSGNNLMELMKTPSLIDKTLFSTVLIDQNPVLFFDYYLQSKQLREQWKKSNPMLAAASFNPDLSQPDYLRDSILKELHKDISEEISIDKNNKDLDFISVMMTDEDSVISKVFVETLVKTVTDYYVTITTAKNQDNVNILQAKADSLSNNFGRRLSNIASAEDINVNPSRRIASVGIQKQQMNVAVDNAVYGEIIKNLELAKIQLQKETPFIQIIEKPRFPLEEEHVSKSISIVVGFILGGMFIIMFLFAKKETSTLLAKLHKYGNDTASSR